MLTKWLFLFTLLVLPVHAQFKGWSKFNSYDSYQKQERTLQPETLELLARIDLEPDDGRKVAIDDVIIALKAANIWNLLDIFYVFPANDLQAALLNWKEDEYNCEDNFDLVYYPEYGFEGEPDKYLETNFTPADDAYHFSITSASLGVIYKHPPYQGEGDPAYIAGTIDYTGLESWTYLQPVSNIVDGDTFCSAQVNDLGPVEAITPNVSFYAMTMTYNESAGFLYVNQAGGESEITPTVTFLSGEELYILAGNDGGTPLYFYNGIVCCVFAGSYLTASQHNVIYNAVKDYIQKFD